MGLHSGVRQLRRPEVKRAVQSCLLIAQHVAHRHWRSTLTRSGEMRQPGDGSKLAGVRHQLGVERPSLLAVSYYHKRDSALSVYLYTKMPATLVMDVPMREALPCPRCGCYLCRRPPVWPQGLAEGRRHVAVRP
jgi:hypothetical protein